MTYRAITACRSCGSSELTTVIDLGNLCINAFPRPDEPDSERAPLELVTCAACTLCQLRHTVEPDQLYRHFWYKSGVTASMRAALKDVVVDARKHVSVSAGDVVIDIGSSDSTLLNEWPRDVVRVGFEPAVNLMPQARESGAMIVNDYFSADLPIFYDMMHERMDETWGGISRIMPKAKVITAIAMFYDLDDPNRFLQDVRSCLADDGVFIVQASYLPRMLATNDVGQNCHEHLEYYSLTSLVPLLKRNGLVPYDVSFNETNGGSFRIFCGHTESGWREKIENVLEAEDHAGQDFAGFARRVEMAKLSVLHLVERFQNVYVYGASSKGNTMLQYWGLNSTMIRGAAERDPRKYGLQTVGSRIPIVSEQLAREKAHAFLVLPWYFRDEIMEREWLWRAAGGKLIFPMPDVEVV